MKRDGARGSRSAAGGRGVELLERLAPALVGGILVALIVLWLVAKMAARS